MEFTASLFVKILWRVGDKVSEEKSQLARCAIVAIWAAAAGILLFVFLATFDLFDVSGQLGEYIRQGAGSDLKFVAWLLLLCTVSGWVFVFLRHSLEDLGIFRKEDQFVDWQEGIDQSSFYGPALSDDPQNLHSRNRNRNSRDWRSRTPLRSRRKPPPKLGTRYINR